MERESENESQRERKEMGPTHKMKRERKRETCRERRRDGAETLERELERTKLTKEMGRDKKRVEPYCIV